MNPFTYIVIVNYNTWEDVIECMESLLRSSEVDFKVILIDNDSPNDSLEHIVNWAKGELKFLPKPGQLENLFERPRTKALTYKFYPEEEFTGKDLSDLNSLLTIVKAKENRGFAAGNNIFLKKATGADAYIWMVNPDLVVEPTTLSKLIKGSGMRRIITGTVVKDYNAPEKILNYGAGKINFRFGTGSYIHKATETSLADYISGGSLFTHASSFEELGLMDESFFLYWEETDWCYRAKQQNYQLKVCAEAIVYDKISTSIGRGYLAEYYYTLNGLRFLKRHKKENVRKVLFFNLLRGAKRLFSLQFKRTKAILDASVYFIFNQNQLTNEDK